MSESETWKDIDGYDGRYQVSNKGNVRSVARKDSMGRKCDGRTLKPRDNSHGYLRVELYKNGIRKQKMVHRLVASAFVPNPKSFLEINHKDENKTNNYVGNLEWCTRKHNINHGTRTERVAQARSKKVRAVNVETGEVLTFNSTREAGNKGYSYGSVAAACRGDYNRGGGNLYRGHKWYYQEENK